MKRMVALALGSILIFAIQPQISGLEHQEVQYFSDNQDPPIIGFNEDNGVFLDQNSTVSGFIVASSIPDSYVWQVSELSHSGVLSPLTLQTPLYIQEIFSNQDDGMTRWSWNISNFFEFPLPSVSTVLNCTCYLSVTVNSGIHESSKSLPIFFGNPVSPALILDSPSDQHSHTATYSNIVEISGWVSSPSGSPVFTSINVINEETSPNTCLTLPNISSPISNSTTSVTFSSMFSGHFSVSIDVTELEDGWYSVWASIQSPDIPGEIKNICLDSRIDNSNPVALLEGPQQVQEGDGDLIFDAGQSFDPYWGKENLNYIWTLIKVETAGSYLVDNSEGTESSFFVVDDAISGDYKLSLLVVDEEGMSSQIDSEFSIINQPPLAKLSISGESLSDGDKMVLSDLLEWDLDASQSLDTGNDIDGLRCVWKINYKTIYEGCERSLQWPEGDDNDSILLTLDVIDDDEEFSSISVELYRANSENQIPFSVIVLILSTLFFISSVIYSRRRNGDMEIPKWNE